MTKIEDKKKKKKEKEEEVVAEEEKEEKAQQDEGEEKKEPVEEEDSNTKYLRLMADFQNYKRRCEKERSDIHAYANEKIVNELLTVMDNFERGLDHELDEGFKEGMDMIFSQLKDVLKKSGVEEIESVDQEFDPNFHNAVLMEEKEDVASGKITEVLQKGYTLNQKVIRPSMVKVAK